MHSKMSLDPQHFITQQPGTSSRPCFFGLAYFEDSSRERRGMWLPLSYVLTDTEHPEPNFSLRSQAFGFRSST